MGDYSINHDTMTALGDGVRHVVASEAQMTPVEMAEALNNYEPPTPGGGGEPAKQINFIDYDGTILYSYTEEEFAQLTSLPENPVHDGLTSQGWNWTKAQITSQLTDAPGGDVWVGQMYVTESGDTEIDITLNNALYISPYLGIAVNGSVTVDWGDESDTDEVEGTSLTTQIRTNHTYPATGDYTIKIHVVSGSFAFYGTSTLTLLNQNLGTSNSNIVYNKNIKAIRIGRNAEIGEYAFANCIFLASVTIPNSITSIGTYAFYLLYALKSVTIPNSVTSIEGYAFYGLYALKSLAIPTSVTSIGDYAFYSCPILKSVTIPNSITSIANNMFNGSKTLTSVTIPNSITSIDSSAFYMCYSIPSLTIPSSVTSIGNSAFYYCYGVKEYHFKSTTPPTLGGTNVFKGILPGCKIYVPEASLNAYKNASNWSSHKTYIYGE